MYIDVINNVMNKKNVNYGTFNTQHDTGLASMHKTRAEHEAFEDEKMCVTPSVRHVPALKRAPAA